MSKVLIIEDELAIAELEKDYLELSDFEVTIEADGTAGLDKYTYLVKESGSSIISSMLMEKSLGMLRRAKISCLFICL